MRRHWAAPPCRFNGPPVEKKLQKVSLFFPVVVVGRLEVETATAERDYRSAATVWFGPLLMLTQCEETMKETKRIKSF